MSSRPAEIYELEQYGFNLLHIPTDSRPCNFPAGCEQCHEVDHLHAISKKLTLEQALANFGSADARPLNHTIVSCKRQEEEDRP